MQGRVRADSRSTAEQTATTAVGLEPAAMTASTGRLVSTASTRALTTSCRDPFATTGIVSAAPSGRLDPWGKPVVRAAWRWRLLRRQGTRPARAGPKSKAIAPAVDPRRPSASEAPSLPRRAWLPAQSAVESGSVGSGFAAVVRVDRGMLSSALGATRAILRTSRLFRPRTARRPRAWHGRSRGPPSSPSSARAGRDPPRRRATRGPLARCALRTVHR